MDLVLPLYILLAVYFYVNNAPRVRAWLKRRRERRDWEILDDAVKETAVKILSRRMLERAGRESEGFPLHLADQDRVAHEEATILAAEIEEAVDRREVGEGKWGVRWEGSQRSRRHELDGPDAR